MTKILALSFVFFSVPGYAPWLVIGALLLTMALFESVLARRRAELTPQRAGLAPHRAELAPQRAAALG